jgi:uroporphyrinogen decarboxylase
MYRDWFKPRHAAVIRAAREARPDLPVCYHSDGNCWDVIPDFIDIGITVLNPVQPECLDLPAVKKQFGDRLIFWGDRYADDDAVLERR